MNRSETGEFESNVELSGKWKKLHDEYNGWVVGQVDNHRTQDRLRRGSRKWLGWCEERELDPIDDVDKDEVNRFIRVLITEDYADTSISRLFSTVSKYYHFLDTDPDHDDIENPTADISLPDDHGIENLSHYVSTIYREGRPDIIAPDKKEVMKVAENPPGQPGVTRERNELIIRLFWQTALRSDELSRVRVDNVDFEEREIQVRSAKLDPQRHKDLYIRRVWWEKNLDYLMHRYMQQRETDSPFFLVGTRGGQLDPQYLSRIVKDAAHNAGVQEPLARDRHGDVSQHLWTAHRMRHARISYLANRTDMDIHHIRMYAGHAKLDTTMKYVKTDWEAARKSYRDALDNG